ncbi:MAG TPA: 3-hydroxyacyl-CoA dehydrogenase NAD-binding domain-containing protein, partial [Burkholderiales bacterium]|nr:3-hydroxyacyl-CoA dehydrogenase NAD-binding domain-containing protein [Burkholderiales bacterium]
MSLDVSRPDLSLAVIGTGVMGRGIAQIAAQAGIRALLHDSRPGAAREAKESVSAQLARLAENGRLERDTLARAQANLVIADSREALASCPIVIEAIVENLDAKRELFRSLEDIVSDDCLMASNTSSFSITAIAAACRRPERIAGFHFFNPVPLMKVVEVVDGLLTAPWVGDALAALALRCGHKPVRAKDTPGFIVNHAGRGYGTEALRILGEGIAEFHEVDRILRDCAGFRLGPFELLDLTGLDVSHPVMESIYRQYYEEPRFRPSPLTGQRVAAGLFGRKSGVGFYRHENGKQEEIPEPPAPASRPASVWVSRSGLGARLTELVAKLGARVDAGAQPAAQSLYLVAPVGRDAT